ncbi:MAG: hypothetical protein A2Y17_02510 [Clostridiales bacterium GWF2_38_85]|nr:MAG: hypothetical protein A2Y17_02510 [Clostridiales bacterium GWF2_38_85]HBL85070.1 hypothetical protein [Clostridiales bacterium]
MSIKLASLLCVQIKVCEAGRTKINIFIPLSIIALYILIDSSIEILELLYILKIGSIRTKGNRYTPKNAIIMLKPMKILLQEAMLHLGRYDFVSVEAGDKDDEVKVLVGTR